MRVRLRPIVRELDEVVMVGIVMEGLEAALAEDGVELL
jgi:hypothetical protein